VSFQCPLSVEILSTESGRKSFKFKKNPLIGGLRPPNPLKKTNSKTKNLCICGQFQSKRNRLKTALLAMDKPDGQPDG
jgi:hypothetical protein